MKLESVDLVGGNLKSKIIKSKISNDFMNLMDFIDFIN